jgi:hypothetical protein
MKPVLRLKNVLAALGALAMLAQAADYSTWARYRPVTVSTVGMGLTAAVPNVPILVRFKASAHKDMLDSAATQVQANGSDIRVTLADGTTDVPFEIEQLTTGPGGRLHIWVLASNITAENASAATFRVYWGKTGQTSMSNPTATFPTSAGYQAVFHLNDTTATIFNSANPALNGTATGTSVIVSQNAGNGFVSAKGGLYVRTFGTSNGGVDNGTAATDYIQFTPGPTHILSTTTGPLTMEGWIYSSITNSGNTSQGTKHIVAHGDGNTGGKAWFARTAALDGTGAQNHYSAGGPNNISGPISPFGEQHLWQFATAVWNGTNWTIYRQRENDFWNNPTVAGPSGMTPDSAKYKVIPGNAPTASTLPWFIGGASDNTGANVTRGWQGWMDEVRISTVARDSNYVKFTFLTSRADTLASITHPVAIGATEAPSAGSYGAWSGHRNIVINTSATGANVATDVVNFPMLVRLGTAEGAILAAANGGNSIRFSKADNTTALPYQIESWSPTAAAIWVKVDSIKGNNATQYIRMHWGNGSAASESNGPAVFDTATTGNGYRAVYHMSAGSGVATEPDATILANNLAASDSVPAAIPTDTIGMIGRARTFKGDTTTIEGRQYFVAPGTRAKAALNWGSTNSHTVSAWVYARSIIDRANHGNSIINKGDNMYALQIYGGGSTTATTKKWESAVYSQSWRQIPSKGTSLATTGSWKYIVGTWSGGALSTNATGQIFIDGVLDSTATTLAIGNGNQYQSWNLFVGANPNGGGLNSTDSAVSGGGTRTMINAPAQPGRARYWDGHLDEIRLARGARSADWIKLEYQNQKSVNSLVDIGLPVYTVPGAPTGVSAVAVQVGANVSWTAPADNGGSPITGYKATIVGDTTLFCETATLTCQITGLVDGTPYNAVVKAINSVGAGPNSSASNVFVPLVGLTPASKLIRMDGNPYTFHLPAAWLNSTEKVTMTITNVQGKQIWSHTMIPSATNMDIRWNGRNTSGQSVAPGMYVVHIRAIVAGQAQEAIRSGIKQ